MDAWDAQRYDEQLAQGLSLAGEDAEYFAAERVLAVKRHVERRGTPITDICELGCGLGRNLRHLGAAFPRARLVGIDSSANMIALARAQCPDPRIVFESSTDFGERAAFDLVFLNGVMHHVPPAERGGVLQQAHALLRVGGLLALFDNNPLNPGAMWVMRRIPFDRDAKPVLAWTLERLARRAGFTRTQIRTHFYFPHALKRLRFAEPLLTRVPLGAQYVLYAERQH